MCTSFTYYNNDFYLGRNLDLDCGFGEEVVITPREYRFQFRHEPTIEKHSAMIGMATIVEGYPLYAEAINEHGLGICSLEFKGNAKYFDLMDGKDNIAPFEIIPWILSNCVTAKEARSYFEKMNELFEFDSKVSRESFQQTFGSRTICQWNGSFRFARRCIKSFKVCKDCIFKREYDIIWNRRSKCSTIF